MSELNVNKISHSNGTDAITIDSSGRVTKSGHPHIFWQGGAESNYNVANGENLFATDDGQPAAKTDGSGLSSIQGGITYTSTTGRFTVPIGGVYHIYAQCYLNEDGSTCRIGGNINGTQRFMGHGGYGAGGGPDNRGTHSAQATIKLDANDYITFTNNAGGTRSCYMGMNHTCGFIYLVG